MDILIKSLINILVFGAVMSIIVIVHELGHLVAAKSFGVYCKEFAVGMGPKVFSIQSKRSETAYSVRALPLGGFVAMAGEPGEEGLEAVPFERTINGIKPWKRLIVMLAGIFMNLVLAFLVFFTIFQINGIVNEPKPVIAAVVEGYPAEKAGLLAGDKFVKLTFKDGTTIEPKVFSDLVVAISSFQDSEIDVQVNRNGEMKDLKLTPVFNEDSQSYVLGIQSEQGSLEKVGFTKTVSYTVSFIANMIVQIFMVLKWLVQGIGLNNVGGPVAIFQETSKVSASGFDMLYFWNLIGSLSISLAVMNFLPIPVLDGGRALLTVVEMIIRRPIPKKFENAIMMIGFAIMLFLMVFFIFNDLKRL